MRARATEASAGPKAMGPMPAFRIGAADDAGEREADAIADRVLGASVLHRKCKKCEEEEERLSRHADGGAVAASAGADVAAVLAEPGRRLRAVDAAYFSARLGTSLAGVRVHDGPAADRAAGSVGARAFALGEALVFARGEYCPDTPDGRHLIAHELAHVAQDRSGGMLRRDASETVWGFPVTRSMCGCRTDLRDDAEFADTMRDAYRACDLPANPTGTDVEACVDAAVPGTVIGGTTSPGGVVTVAPTSADPCGRIEARATRVHEHFHVRQADRYARRIGGAYFEEWRRLAGDPDREAKIAASHPAEHARFLDIWNDGHAWARGEIESYTWERRFLVDVGRALGRICS